MTTGTVLYGRSVLDADITVFNELQILDVLEGSIYLKSFDSVLVKN
jgi:hypothetical protein